MQAVREVAGRQPGVQIQEIDLLAQGRMFRDQTRHKGVKRGPDGGVERRVIHPQEEVCDYQLGVRTSRGDAADEVVETIGGVRGVLALAVIAACVAGLSLILGGDRLTGINPLLFGFLGFGLFALIRSWVRARFESKTPLHQAVVESTAARESSQIAER